jgi:hypothetical protein
MNTIDAVMFTLLNTIVCFSLPKLLSLMTPGKNKRTALDSRSQTQPGNLLKRGSASYIRTFASNTQRASARSAIRVASSVCAKRTLRERLSAVRLSSQSLPHAQVKRLIASSIVDS